VLAEGQTVQTYLKEYIHHIHQQQNDIPNPRLVKPKAHQDQRTRNDVMREHLPVVFPTLLDVDHDNLLQPECKLHEVVPFHDAGDVDVGEVRPELGEVEPVGRVVHDVL